jgi:putative heme iron utilization protein
MTSDRGLTDQARALLERARWLALATVAADGEPAVSYVPFAPVAGGLGIVVSALAAHTAQLSAHPRVALLLVDDPPGDDAFVRPRLSIEALARPAPDPAAVWDALTRSLGATAEILRTLPDFRPLLLVPVRARIVLGFGRAGEVDAAALLVG